MKVAFAGLGAAFTRAHLPASLATPAMQVVAAADIDDDRRRAFAARCPTAAGFDDAATMIAAVDADLVVLAVDPTHHPRLAAAALLRGMHVLSEKPAALDADGVERLGRACARRPQHALVSVHQYRHSPPWRSMARWTRAMAIVCSHTILDARVERAGDDAAAATPWRADLGRSGGLLADHAVHFLALADGLGLRAVPAAADRVLTPGGSETVSALLETATGSMRLSATRAAARRATTIEARGGALAATWRNDRFETRLGTRVLRRRAVPSLASRDHVDWLYRSLYAELIAHLKRDPWRAARTAQTLRVSRTLVALLDLARRAPDLGSAG